MDRGKAGKSSCRSCGAKLPSGHFESTHRESMNRCSRCAMVSELISELIRKQVHAATRAR
jgi:hypothetical protein